RGPRGLDVGPYARPVAAANRDLADLLLRPRERRLEHRAERRLTRRGDEPLERAVDETRAHDAEQGGPRQVHVQDEPLLVEGEVARRRELVEVRVTLQRRLDFVP